MACSRSHLAHLLTFSLFFLIFLRDSEEIKFIEIQLNHSNNDVIASGASNPYHKRGGLLRRGLLAMTIPLLAMTIRKMISSFKLPTVLLITSTSISRIKK